MKPTPAIARFKSPVLALLLALAAGVAGCAQYAAMSESMFMMTPQQETELGAQVAQKVGSESKFVTDPAIVNYVREVGQKVWRSSPQSEFNAQFAVIKDDSINAFAIPGGNIYVNTGLITAADDEAELASVIAHEAGHVVRRHAARQLSHQQGVELVQQLALGQNSPVAAQLAASFIQGTGLLVYSRGDETEADTIAVNTLARAGYDPAGMKRLFTKLTANEGKGSSMAKWFSTHPPTRERIALIDQRIAQLPQGQYQSPTKNLQAAKARLKELGMGPKAEKK